jgi:hypothetical protein
MVTCARETLINEWDGRGTKSSEGVHSLGWAGTFLGIVVEEYQWVVDLEL